MVAAVMVCIRVLLILSAQMVQQLYDAIIIFDVFLHHTERNAVQEREIERERMRLVYIVHQQYNEIQEMKTNNPI